MTSLTFQDNQDDCCFSSFYRNSKQNKSQRIDEKTMSNQITFKKGSPILKLQQTNKDSISQKETKFQTAQKFEYKNKNLGQTSSQTKNGVSNTTKKIVNVNLNYSIDNCEEANQSSKQISIQQVESQIYSRPQTTDKNSNEIISESEILYNYFDSSEYIKMPQPNNTEIKPQEPKRIKRLFKTQKNT